jgi:hypothetical protein
MTVGEFKAWEKRTATSVSDWQLDEIHNGDRGDYLFYRGGVNGKFIEISRHGLLMLGEYEGAIPHIGDATFHVRFTKQFPLQVDALVRVKQFAPSIPVDLSGNTSEKVQK